MTTSARLKATPTPTQTMAGGVGRQRSTWLLLAGIVSVTLIGFLHSPVVLTPPSLPDSGSVPPPIPTTRASALRACVGARNGTTQLFRDDPAVASIGRASPPAHESRSERPRIVINVLANQRLTSLQRLCESLLAADYLGDDDVALEVHLEADQPPDLLQYVTNLEWPNGPKTVHARMVKGGLIAVVVESWWPTSDNEVAVLLEDDIEVSPLFYRWLRMSLDAWTEAGRPDDMLGVSLYTPRVIETRQPDHRHKSRQRPLDLQGLVGRLTGGVVNSPFRQQLPCSWGALYFPKPWREFASFMRLRTDNGRPESLAPGTGQVVIPHSLTTGWKGSWKKYLMELCWAKGWFLLYPNFPEQQSLATNHLEVGEHIAANDANHKREHFTVPLLRDPAVLHSAGDAERQGQLPPLFTLPLLNLFSEPYDVVPRPPTTLPNASDDAARASWDTAWRAVGQDLVCTPEDRWAGKLVSRTYNPRTLFAYALCVQEDGNLVVYHVDGAGDMVEAVWSSGSGAPQHVGHELRLRLGSDGRLTLVRIDREASSKVMVLWQSSYRGPSTRRYFLYVHETGEVVVYHGDSPCADKVMPVWSTSGLMTHLEPCARRRARVDPAWRRAGDDLVTTPKRATPAKLLSETQDLATGTRHHLVVQEDGNLVVYLVSGAGELLQPVWSSDTGSRKLVGKDLRLQLNARGTLALTYRGGIRTSTVWSSGFRGRPGPHFLYLHANGNLVVYRGSDPCAVGVSAVWSSRGGSRARGWQRGFQVQEPCAVRRVSMERASQACRHFLRPANHFMRKATDDTFTLVLPHSSGTRLFALLPYYAASPLVERIVVVWSTEASGPAPRAMLLQQHTRVDFLEYKHTVRSQHLNPSMLVTTRAVLLLDDNLKVHHGDLEALFQAWQGNTKRVLGLIAGEHGAPSSRALLFHANLLFEFTCGCGFAAHSVVDRAAGCEGLALGLLLRRLHREEPTTTHPLAVVPPSHPIGWFPDDATRRPSRDPGRCAAELLGVFELGPADMPRPSRDLGNSAMVDCSVDRTVDSTWPQEDTAEACQLPESGS